MSVDPYVRGWEDALEVLSTVIRSRRLKTTEQVLDVIDELATLVKEKKVIRIKDELGI